MLRENGLSKNGTLFRGIVPCAPVLAVEIARLMLIPILLLPLLRSLLTFLTFLRMRHKGLFIIASDIIESHFVDLDRISGHFFYVFYDNLVIRMFLIVLVALGTHVTRQIVDRPAHVGTAFADQRTDHLSQQAQKMVIMTLNGDSNLEIAKKLNVTINTVKSTKLKAYQILRKRLRNVQWFLVLLT